MPECSQGQRSLLRVVESDNTVFYKMANREPGAAAPKKKPRKPGILSMLLIAAIFFAAVYVSVGQVLHASGFILRMQ